MYVYWPEKYRSHFLHVLSFFLKVWVSVVSFDGFFSFTYQSHNLWSWPLERVWYQHTLLSQRSPTLPYIFCFIRKGIMEPSLLCVFLLPPGFFLGWGCVKEYLVIYKEFFYENFWNFKAIPNTKTILTSVWNKFVLKTIQVIPLGRFESLCFVVLVKVWSDVLLVRMVQALIWGF
jgi:hypothetical protein